MSTAIFLIVLFGSMLGIGLTVGWAFQTFSQGLIRSFEVEDAFDRAARMQRNIGSGYTKEQADEARQLAERMARGSS